MRSNVFVKRLAMLMVSIAIMPGCEEDVDYAPVVTINEPHAGAVVGETFVVEVETSAHNGIYSVELYLNNTLVGKAHTEPYLFTVNTLGYSAGVYTLKAVSYSNSAKFGSTEISISIARPSMERPLEFTASKGRFGNKIALSWNKSPGANQYEVYKQDVASLEYEKIATVSDNIFEDVNIGAPLTQYFYKVRAFNSETLFSEFSEYDYGYSNGKAYDLITSFGREGTDLDEFEFVIHIAYHNNELYVADDQAERVMKYSKEGNVIGLYQSGNYPIAPYFFGNKSLNIFGGMINIQEGDNLVKSFQPDLIGLRQVTVDDENNIYVTASNSNKVAKYDLEGNLLLSWGVEGDLPGQFNAPWGIAFYNDNIVVSNYFSKKVQFFSKSGQFIKEWTFGDAVHGIDICVRNGYLYIAFGSFIAKTDYDGVIVEKIYGEFEYGTGIALDENDDIFVTDPYQRKIYVYRKSI